MPSLFSGAVDSQRSLVGLIWSVIMVIAGISIMGAFIRSNSIKSRYANNAKLGGYYYDDMDDDVDMDDDDNNSNSGSGDGDMYYYYYLLASVHSTPLLASTIYASSLVGLISLYGSAFVIGFVGPTGKYVKPFFGGTSSMASLHFGIFVGILFAFANFSLVYSLIFSNVWVLDYIEGREKENMPPYAVEMFARTFCYLFLFFAFIFAAFAWIVLSFHDSILERDNDLIDELEVRKQKPHFITRDETPSY